MKLLKNRASRGAVALTLMTGTLMIGTSAFASCNSDKKTTTASYSTPATVVLAGYTKTDKKGTIVDRAVKTESLSTLVAAVKAAGLVDTLASPGPFTVFAPTNKAFDGLPTGTVDTLLKPENKEALTKVLTAHVVAGNLKAADIMHLAKENGGTVEVTTVSGDTLTAVLAGDTLYVKDEKGGLAKVKKADISQSNGTVHIVSRVLLPN